jgi:hypothetical protein
MKLTLKILKLIAVIFLTLSVLLFSASFLMQETVASIILRSLNKNISTKLDIGSFRLSFLKKFPKASLELRDVLVHSSAGFNPAAFKGLDTDTLLAARFVSVEFKITDILKGVYNIERIGVRAGKINFFTDTEGLVNYNITEKAGSSQNNNFTIDLERINLKDIKASYHNAATKLIIKGIITGGKLKSRISGPDVDFTADAGLDVTYFKLNNVSMTKPVKADLELTLKSSKTGLLFKKGTLSIEKNRFELNGSISADNILDLTLAGDNVDISRIGNFLPVKYSDLVSDYNPSGIVIVKGSIKGLLSRTSGPHIEISCLLKNGHISYRKTHLAVNELTFSAVYSNGSRNRRETSSLTINDLKAKFGSGQYTGSFRVDRFDNASAELKLRGRVFPGELKEFFNIQEMSTASGSVDMDLKMKSNLRFGGKFTISDIIDMKPEAELIFNALNIGFKNDSILFNQVNGNMNLSNSIHADNMQFIYKRQRLKVDGEFINLPEWLEGRPVLLIAEADISFNRFIPEAFSNETRTNESKTSRKRAFTLPDDIRCDLVFKIDSLSYKSFSASGISGKLNYKPKLLTFESLNMNSLNGSISGNGFVVQNVNKSVLGRGSFNISKVDIKKAFTTFHNFGQTFLKAENIAGTLSGSLSVLLPMDSLMRPQIKSVTAEGKYLLNNGALINFDPVKQLSNFIELSELENISFDQMENDFFIRNNFLYIPQMAVRSSAVDLSVNGKHSFDNNYEYHVKMLLSEFLSKKRNKTKSNYSEFGIIEEDGLNRTSLLLKIVDKGEGVKVGYDMKAAGNEVKNNIKAERQTLKTILNQEYGWFKGDSVPPKKPVKKSRFRITWDERDSVGSTPESPADKKESTEKNPFRKK